MSIHKAVLLKETIEILNLKKGDTVIDATFGGGGHSFEILKRIGEKGKLIAIDADEKAIENFKIKNTEFKKNENIVLVNDNFSNLADILDSLKIEKVDAVLADLGWSSDQLIGKGMSFMQDEELDMRLSMDQEFSAKEVVNEYSEKDLARIIRDFGEERFWKKITRNIIEKRKVAKIEKTKELADIISQAIPERFRHMKLNPATRTFQAIRIEVNQELKKLKEFIPQAIENLNTHGRLAIISFHSLEDRIVKENFRKNARGCICPIDFPKCICGEKPKVLVITKKPIIASDDENLENPRARSAKLRACEKC